MRITLFAKEGKPTVKEVTGYLKARSGDFTVYEGKRRDKFPKEALSRPRDIVISYLFPRVIPREILESTKFWNINFHPAPPEFPGIGCFNFAIYNKERNYGVTAHLMNEKVDTGKIIGVKRFPILKSDSVYSLSVKSYKHMFSLFVATMNFILKRKKLPSCGETWSRAPYTRRELEALCRVDPGMAKDEIERKIKATAYPGMPGAYMDLFGYRFEYNSER